MKVILIQNIPGLGKIGEIKDVAHGYGKNFLLPRKLALQATPQAVNQVKSQRRTLELSQERIETELAEVGQQLDGMVLTFKVKAGTQERLYGSITSSDIAKEIQNKGGPVIDKRKIEMEESLRHLGSFEVPVKLSKDVVPVINVIIEE